MSSSLFMNKGFLSAGFINFTPREAYQEATENHTVIVDVREQGLTGYKQFDVRNVISLPNSQIHERFTELPSDKPLILADSVGLRSKEAILFLMTQGFENIANLAGGLVEWERDGLPIKLDNKERLDGSCMCQLKPRNRLKK